MDDFDRETKFPKYMFIYLLRLSQEDHEMKASLGYIMKPFG